MVMKRILLWIWKWMPGWMQQIAAALIRPRFQVAVAVLILNETGQLLLCEHTYRRANPWGLPGGDLKFAEDPRQAIRRELLEETGLRMGAVRLLLVENSERMRHVCLTYLGTGVEGSFVPNEEVSSIRYFDPDHLPPFLPEHGRTIQRALAELDCID